MGKFRLPRPRHKLFQGSELLSVAWLARWQQGRWGVVRPILHCVLVRWSYAAVCFVLSTNTERCSCCWFSLPVELLLPFMDGCHFIYRSYFPPECEQPARGCALILAAFWPPGAPWLREN